VRSTWTSKQKSPVRFPVLLCFEKKKKVCPRTRISCLQALQCLLYALSSFNQSFMSFPFHDELLKVMSSFQERKIQYRIENRPYEEPAPNSCQCSVRGYCSNLNVVKCPWKNILLRNWILKKGGKILSSRKVSHFSQYVNASDYWDTSNILHEAWCNHQNWEASVHVNSFILHTHVDLHAVLRHLQTVSSTLAPEV